MKDRRIETLELEPDIFVTLKPGWQYDGAHCFGEDSLADVKATMRFVRKCDCAECNELIKRSRAHEPV